MVHVKTYFKNVLHTLDEMDLEKCIETISNFKNLAKNPEAQGIKNEMQFRLTALEEANPDENENEKE